MSPLLHPMAPKILMFAPTLPKTHLTSTYQFPLALPLVSWPNTRTSIKLSEMWPTVLSTLSTNVRLPMKLAKMEALACIKDCDEEIAGLQVQLAQLHSTLSAYESPKGFSNNDGHVSNLISLSNGLFIPAKWVHQ
jgi:hypothetical protein